MRPRPGKPAPRSINEYTVGEVVDLGAGMRLRIISVADDGTARFEPASEADGLRMQLTVERFLRKMTEGMVPKTRLRTKVSILRKAPERRKRQTENARKVRLSRRASGAAGIEQEVLRLRSQGWTKARIARALGIGRGRVARIVAKP